MWIKCLAEGQKCRGTDGNRTRNPLIQSQGFNPIYHGTSTFQKIYHWSLVLISFNTLRFDFVNFRFILCLVSECKLQYLPSYLKFLVYRANKPPLGQLIRSFIVTPPPPVYIKLNPRVRPGPHPTPVFMPLLGEEGVTLSASSMWVLRYPYPLSFIKILRHTHKPIRC